MPRVTGGEERARKHRRQPCHRTAFAIGNWAVSSGKETTFAQHRNVLFDRRGGDAGSVKISPLMANIICFLMANEATGDSKRENYPRLQQWKDDCATAAATITRRYRRHHPKLELLRSAKSERANERAPSTSRRVIPFRFFPPSVVATHDATSDRTKYGERASLCCRFCVALSMEGDLSMSEKNSSRPVGNA